jgi:hypothetical protein
VVVVVLVVVVVRGALVVGGAVWPATVLGRTVVAVAVVVAGAAVVVATSKICSGASTNRARPWNTAKTAFMLSVLRRGSITESSPTLFPTPSTWYVFIVEVSRFFMALAKSSNLPVNQIFSNRWTACRFIKRLLNSSTQKVLLT